MNDQEEPAPSAPVLEIRDDEAGSDEEQASSAHKRRKTSLSMCKDKYDVTKQKSHLVFCAKPWRTAKTPETLKGLMSSRKAW